MAYLAGFSVVYLVVVVAILGMARKWRARMREVEERARTASARRLTRMSAASADVHDALSYQKRANEGAQRRIRRAEEQARENADAAARNARVLEESREANSRLAGRYAAGTALLGEHARNVGRAADAARTQAFARARENARLLRELEREIEAAYKGAVTPGEVAAEVARLEAELAEHRRQTRDASDRFYRQVGSLMAAGDAAQRATMDEITTMFATKEEAGQQASELLADVERAEGALRQQYAAVLDRAGEVATGCAPGNLGELDAAALERIQATYDQVLDRVAGYSASVEQHEAAWAEMDARVRGVEDTVAASAGSAADASGRLDAALLDLKTYIASNCLPQTAVDGVRDEIQAASRSAALLDTRVSDAVVECRASKTACDQARAECTAAGGRPAVNLAEGGVINVENAGTLSLSGGNLAFCDTDQVCTRLN